MKYIGDMRSALQLETIKLTEVEKLMNMAKDYIFKDRNTWGTIILIILIKTGGEKNERQK